jgi:hypothetical protein
MAALSRAFPKLKTVSPWLIIAGVGLLLIVVIALSGLIQNYLDGEEFLIFSFADRLPHDQAWQSFFHRFGRPIEALYWTYEYELIGFNPLLAHIFSFIQLLTLSILAAACFVNCWPQNKRSPSLPYLLAFSLFLSWVSLSSILRLSYDNGRLSLVFFFLAGLALQKWAASQRTSWLALSLISFLVSVFTYENAAFLFPALVLLSMPLLPAGQRDSKPFKTYLFLSLGVLSGLLLLIPRLFYTYVASPIATPALDFGLGDLFTRLAETAPSVYLGFGQFFSFQSPLVNLTIGLALLLTLALSAWVLLSLSGVKRRASTDRKRGVHIILASLWFLVFGPLPYILLGYGVFGRVYSSAVFGVFPLILLAHQFAPKAWLRSLAPIILAFFAITGLLTLWSESRYFAQWEAPLNIFYRGLKDAVPHVRPNTTIIIVNGPIGNQGCGPSLEMLYGQEDLDCLVIASSAEQGSIRRHGEFQSNGLTLLEGNWIIVSVVDNVPTVIDELRPGDYDLMISWETNEPMRTSSGRILTDNIPPATQFYMHLLERAKILSASQ